LFISDVVLCEAVWVLGSRYGFSRAEVAEVLQQLLRAKHLSFIAPDQLARALDAFAKEKGDFSDYIIREHAQAAGCEQVATFDRALLSSVAFVAP
jgi:predicted nucleic-acid-binding protein